MSPDSATARAPPPTFAAHADTPFTAHRGGLPVGSRTPLDAAGLGRRSAKARTPSVGLMLGLATEWSVMRGPCHVRTHSAPHPFARRDEGSPRQGMSLHAVLSRVLLVRLAALLDRTGVRCFLPTSATDARHVHPRTIRFLSVRLSPTTTDIALPCDSLFSGPQSFFAMPASCCLAATRPQVDVRLTAPTELWFRRSQPLLISEKSRAPLRAELPCRGVFDRVQGWRRIPLTLPVALRGRSETRTPTKNQSRFHRPLVNEGSFPDPERLPSTSAPASPAFARVRFLGSPPPISRLCRRDPASGPLSPLRCSRTEGLDSFVSTGFHPWRTIEPHAACRLLQPK